MIGLVNTGGGGGKVFAFIVVTYPADSVCTCTDSVSGKTLTAKDTTGSYVFEIPSAGTWTVSCTDGSQTAQSDPISITTKGQSKSTELSYYIPSAYQALTYIQSNGTQYIDTGYKGNTSKTKFITSINFTDISGTVGVFGSRNAQAQATSPDACCIFLTSNEFRWDWASANTTAYSANITANTDYTIEITRGSVKLNGAVTTYSATGSVDQNYNFLIFSFNDHGTPYASKAKYKFKGGQILEDNVVIHEYVPCKRRSDNVLGLYDRITGDFLTKAVGDNFIGGEPI